MRLRVVVTGLVAIAFLPATARATTPGAPGSIAFWAERNGSFNVYEVKPDGSGRTRLTTFIHPQQASEPAWSPDGTRLVMNATVGTTTGLFVANADGSGMTSLGIDGGDPSWSPDGTRIAFDRGFEIWTIGANGADPVRLTSGTGLDVRPDWSPDGSRIAFDSNRSGSFDIWTMAADGSGAVDLTANSSAYEADPSWSPDGSRIAFTSDRRSRGDFDLYVMRRDGSHVRRLTRGRRDDLQPSWSPDGTQIAFVSSRDGDFDLFTIATNGTRAVKISSTRIFEEQPAWQSDPAA